MTKLFQNLNGNLLCSIDCETTGTKPNIHDIIQVAIIPLDLNLKPDKERLPFICDMKPSKPENADGEAMRINRQKICDLMIRGIDKWRAIDLLIEWFDKLKLGYNKKIMPLGCNWPFDREFLIEWLGHETFWMYFHPQYRDVQAVASYHNDIAGYKGNQFPYPKVNLGYLCTQLKIERYGPHDATDDARVTAEVYRKMIFNPPTML